MNKRILLADDSLTIQKVVELTFMDEDYDVDAVGTGDDAIRQLQEDLPDIVIADVHMPGASGYEVCRRAKELNGALPVLLLVGTFEALDDDEMAASGADGHLKKPFDSQELLQVILDMTAAEVQVAEFDDAPAVDVEPEAEAHDLEEPALETVATTYETEDSDELGSAAGFDFGGPSEDSSETVETATDFEPNELSLEVDESLDLPPALDFHEGAGDEDPSDLADGGDSEPEALGETTGDDFEEAATAVLDAAAFDQLEEQMQASVEVDPEPEVAASEVADVLETEPEASFESAESEGAAESTEVDMPAVAGALSDDDVERIARRVVEMLSDDTVREVAWDVIPDLAEIVIKARIRELEAEAG